MVWFTLYWLFLWDLVSVGWSLSHWHGLVLFWMDHLFFHPTLSPFFSGFLSWGSHARLHFPVWQEFISWTQKTVPARIPQDSWGFLFVPEEFFTGTTFWRGSQEFLFFADITGFFCRNSCGTGIPVFTPDFSGFLRIPPDSCFRQNCLALASD